MRIATRRRFTGLAVLAAALILVSTMFNLATAGGRASSHRETPKSAKTRRLTTRTSTRS